MKKTLDPSRRDFLRLTGLATAGAAMAGIPVPPGSHTVVGGENPVCCEITGLSRFSESRRRWGIGYVSWHGASFQH